jgi:hypothetical protein
VTGHIAKFVIEKNPGIIETAHHVRTRGFAFSAVRNIPSRIAQDTVLRPNNHLSLQSKKSSA